ncbi:MAG: TIGR01777 family oxidoreductase [Deltaproteobacteria bacterium]|nr:TIGR01777 family oxidoreductase [Deltaproteobacteria bacterium]
MKILMTGGTGFIGSFLTDKFIRDGHEVSILIRKEIDIKKKSRNITFINGAPTVSGPWQHLVNNYDVIINLTGASIFSRWTGEQKKLIKETRINSTRNIVDALDANLSKAVTLFNASAVGYYGFHGDEELTEEAPPGNDFLATVAKEWEKEALEAKKKGVRVCIMRFGIVLGTDGGIIGRMIPLFKNFLGGPIGNGKQWFSWVHADDLTEAFSFLLKHPELSGPFNVCSPVPVRNKGLVKAIGKALKRPSLMPLPGFIIRLVLGEFGCVILKGQKVLPRRLIENGFIFKHQNIDDAIAAIITN